MFLVQSEKKLEGDEGKDNQELVKLLRSNIGSKSKKKKKNKKKPAQKEVCIYSKLAIIINCIKRF